MGHIGQGGLVPMMDRPQTSQVLSAAEGRIGPSGKFPSTAASSAQEVMGSSRGFGDLGSTMRNKDNVRKV